MFGHVRRKSDTAYENLLTYQTDASRCLLVSVDRVCATAWVSGFAGGPAYADTS